jgi:hypothetical protein
MQAIDEIKKILTDCLAAHQLPRPLRIPKAAGSPQPGRYHSRINGVVTPQRETASAAELNLN